MLKFSLGTLFVVVAVVALGCAAVANFSPLWAAAMVTLVAAALLAALLTALVGEGQGRIFAVGFATIGGAYLLLAFVPAMGLRDQLLTSRATHWLYAKKQGTSGGQVVVSVPAMNGSMDPYASMNSGMMGNSGMPMGPINTTINVYPGMMGSATVPIVINPDAPRELQDIGHAFWTLVLALGGGVLAQAIRRSRRRQAA